MLARRLMILPALVLVRIVEIPKVLGGGPVVVGSVAVCEVANLLACDREGRRRQSEGDGGDCEFQHWFDPFDNNPLSAIPA
jgi:hypothetical protein